MDSGNSSDDTQCIYRPFTPEKGQRNTRGAFGRFKRTLKLKKTTRESLSEQTFSQGLKECLLCKRGKYE